MLTTNFRPITNYLYKIKEETTFELWELPEINGSILNPFEQTPLAVILDVGTVRWTVQVCTLPLHMEMGGYRPSTLFNTVVPSAEGLLQAL